MTDTYCIYHISYPTTHQKIFDLDLICPVIIKKTKVKLKLKTKFFQRYISLMINKLQPLSCKVSKTKKLKSAKHILLSPHQT